MAQLQPRGLRLNNPLNIRLSANRWRGKVSPSCDPDFEQFVDIFYGIRAAFVILRTYMGTRYRLNTLEQIIARWAPSTENDTAAYIATVRRVANFQTGERFAFRNKNQCCRLLWAMARVEVGQSLPFNYFERAYAMV